MRADRRDPVIAALRRHKPTRFEVELRDGTSRELKLSTKQNRWELLSETLEAMPWTSIKALDESGAVLGAVEREQEVEEDDGYDTPSEEVGRLTTIMLKAVQTTMSETRKMFADTMKAQSELMASMVESVRAVQENYTLALKVQAMHAVSSGGGEGSDDAVMKMMQMAAMMMTSKGATPPQAPQAPPPAPKVIPATQPPSKKA